MLRRIGVIAERENLNLAFWEDGLINNTDGKPFNRLAVFPATIDVYGFVWQTVWEWWGGDRAFNLANDDYKVQINISEKKSSSIMEAFCYQSLVC